MNNTNKINHKYYISICICIITLNILPSIYAEQLPMQICVANSIDTKFMIKATYEPNLKIQPASFLVPSSTQPATGCTIDKALDYTNDGKTIFQICNDTGATCYYAFEFNPTITNIITNQQTVNDQYDISVGRSDAHAVIVKINKK